MVLRQHYLGCLAHASYFIGDERSGEAAVIDPQRDIEQYLADARETGLAIRHVILTHFHADFLAGHLELRDRAGARIYIGSRGEAEYDHTALGDGDEIVFGDVRLATMETPGHSPESISLVLSDTARDPDAPRAVFTGDTLFIGDVGRPDLHGSFGWSVEDLAALLYESIHKKLLTLPDETLIYPAHGAGSLCGRNLSRETVSTMGVQRRYNYALQPMTKDEFVAIVAADQPDAPAYFAYDAALNRQERPTLDQALERELHPLPLAEVTRLRGDGAQIIDARDPASFEAAHMQGAINIGLSGEYATWAGTLLNQRDPIVIIAEPGRVNEAATRLGRIGFDHVVGYLDGGMESLDGHPHLVRQTERITAPTVAETLAGPEPPFVLDVRTPAEWRRRRIRGSVNIPLSRLRDQLSRIPRDRGVVVHCGSGYRSAIAASLLERSGVANVADMVGGIDAWSASRLATETSDASAM